MRRIQFIELHEQPWFPAFLRDDLTDTLQFGLNALNAYGPIVTPLQTALACANSRSIVDLCSGAGGPWQDLSSELAGNGDLPLRILLTDRNPYARAQKDKLRCDNQIAFRREPVDAMNVPHELTGFRTMFSSFHHFAPEQARAVLQNAVDAGEGLGVFEVTSRDFFRIALMFLWALAAFAFVPFVRPFRWSRVFWTYALPVIPLVLLFDGVVSCLRTYKPAELRGILMKLRGPEYHWEFGRRSGGRGNPAVTYFIGYPRAAGSANSIGRFSVQTDS